MKSEIGEIRYVTWDKVDCLILDVVILLDEPSRKTNQRTVLGCNTEYSTFTQCLWNTLDDALNQYPDDRWYRYLSDKPDVKYQNHKWKYYEQDSQTETI